MDKREALRILARRGIDVPNAALRTLGPLVAPAVVLLASPVSGWITGQTLSISGGYSMVG